MDTNSEVRELYRAGKTGEEISALYDMERTWAYRRLRAMGEPLRSNSVSHQRYKLDTSVFDSIDTEEKAYWLGFLTADGNLCGNLLQVDLMLSDKGHLEKLRGFLGSDHPVLERATPYLQARLAISNERLASALRDLNLGFGNDKTHDARPWSGPNNLLSHYWRGVIDGDGSLYISSKKWNLALQGTPSICSAFSVWAQNLSSNSKGVVRLGHGDVWCVRYSGDLSATSIIRGLYEHATVSLDRKKIMADKAMARLALGDRRLIVREHSADGRWLPLSQS